MRSKVVKQGKKSIFRFIFSRKMLLILAFLFNIYVIILASDYIDSFVDPTMFAVLSVILILIIFNREGTSVIKMSWCIMISAFPVFGGLFYLLNQVQVWISRRRRNLPEERKLSAHLMQENAAALRAIEEADDQALSVQTYYLGDRSFPAYGDNDVRFFGMGDEYLPAIIEELKGAKEYIRIECFIVSYGKLWDEVHGILKRKAAEGVDVKLMYDGTNMLSDFGSGYAKTLREEGIDARVFSPLVPFVTTEQNNRDHRKIFIVDGRVAFTGGCNLADEYANIIERFGVWKDTGIRIEGPAVKSLDIIFMQMWNADVKRRGGIAISYDDYEDKYKTGSAVEDPSKGILIPYADNPLDDHLVADNVYITLINAATKYVYCTTPYLVPDETLMNALELAARRGVDVRIMMPHIPDKKFTFMLSHSYYEHLITRGVRIYEFEPGFVHAKELISDGMHAAIGTANLDFRSLYMNYENGVYMYNVPAIADMEKDYLKTIEQCIKVDDWKYGMNWAKYLCGRIARILAPLF